LISKRFSDLPQLERHIKRRLDEVACRNPEFSDFLRFLSRHGRVVVFGGFVRDCIHNYIHGQTIRPRDLDVVVDGAVLPTKEDGTNNFGGHRRWLGHELKIDFWELNRTYAFSTGLFTPSLANLPLTTVYTVNACFFDLNDNRLVEKRCHFRHVEESHHLQLH
jgi:hypothetical protein